jgi:hypothetical protein
VMSSQMRDGARRKWTKARHRRWEVKKYDVSVLAMR